jgi:hypothetical protein
MNDTLATGGLAIQQRKADFIQKYSKSPLSD